jgi:hypothetical protein
VEKVRKIIKERKEELEANGTKEEDMEGETGREDEITEQRINKSQKSLKLLRWPSPRILRVSGIIGDSAKHAEASVL